MAGCLHNMNKDALVGLAVPSDILGGLLIAVLRPINYDKHLLNCVQHRR